MSFAAGKILWYLAAPANLVTVLLIVGLALQVTRWRRFGRRLALGVAAVLVALTLLPVGELLLKPLEDRFPAPAEPPARVDGIILLGGATELTMSESRDQPSLNDSAERILAFVELAHRYPAARLVASGGSGLLRPGRLLDSDVTREVLRQVGFDTSRVVFESKSRNTFENARYAHEAVQPAAGETWLLVTSAAHMPRAVGCFRRVGWPVRAFPVDYRTRAAPKFGLRLGLASGLAGFQLASHEWVGLLVYWLLDRTSALFPRPAEDVHAAAAA